MKKKTLTILSTTRTTGGGRGWVRGEKDENGIHVRFGGSSGKVNRSKKERLI